MTEKKLTDCRKCIFSSNNNGTGMCCAKYRKEQGTWYKGEKCKDVFQPVGSDKPKEIKKKTCKECGYFQDDCCWNPENYNNKKGYIAINYGMGNFRPVVFRPVEEYGCEVFKPPRDFDEYNSCFSCRFAKKNNPVGISCKDYRRSIGLFDKESCRYYKSLWRPIVKKPELDEKKTCNDCGYLDGDRCYDDKIKSFTFKPTLNVGCSDLKLPRDFDGFGSCSKCRFSIRNNGTDMLCGRYRKTKGLHANGSEFCGFCGEYWRPVVKPAEPKPLADLPWKWEAPAKCKGCKHYNEDNQRQYCGDGGNDYGNDYFIVCDKDHCIKHTSNKYKGYHNLCVKNFRDYEPIWVWEADCEGCVHHENLKEDNYDEYNTMRCEKEYMVKCNKCKHPNWNFGKRCSQYKSPRHEWIWVAPDACDGCKHWTDDGILVLNLSGEKRMLCNKKNWIKCKDPDDKPGHKGEECDDYEIELPLVRCRDCQHAINIRLKGYANEYRCECNTMNDNTYSLNRERKCPGFAEKTCENCNFTKISVGCGITEVGKKFEDFKGFSWVCGCEYAFDAGYGRYLWEPKDPRPSADPRYAGTTPDKYLHGELDFKNCPEVELWISTRWRWTKMLLRKFDDYIGYDVPECSFCDAKQASRFGIYMDLPVNNCGNCPWATQFGKCNTSDISWWKTHHDKDRVAWENVLRRIDAKITELISKDEYTVDIGPPKWTWIAPCKDCEYWDEDPPIKTGPIRKYTECKKCMVIRCTVDWSTRRPCNWYKKKEPGWAWEAPTKCDGCKHWTDHGEISKGLRMTVMYCKKGFNIKTTPDYHPKYYKGKKCCEYEKSWIWTADCADCEHWTEERRCKKNYDIHSNREIDRNCTWNRDRCSLYKKKDPEWTWIADCTDCENWGKNFDETKTRVNCKRQGHSPWTVKSKAYKSKAYKFESRKENCEFYKKKEPVWTWETDCGDCEYAKEENCEIKLDWNNVDSFMKCGKGGNIIKSTSDDASNFNWRLRGKTRYQDCFDYKPAKPKWAWEADCGDCIHIKDNEIVKNRIWCNHCNYSGAIVKTRHNMGNSRTYRVENPRPEDCEGYEPPEKKWLWEADCGDCLNYKRLTNHERFPNCKAGRCVKSAMTTDHSYRRGVPDYHNCNAYKPPDYHNCNAYRPPEKEWVFEANCTDCKYYGKDHVRHYCSDPKDDYYIDCEKEIAVKHTNALYASYTKIDKKRECEYYRKAEQYPVGIAATRTTGDDTVRVYIDPKCPVADYEKENKKEMIEMSEKTCPSCGATEDREGLYCSQCGINYNSIEWRGVEYKQMKKTRKAIRKRIREWLSERKDARMAKLKETIEKLEGEKEDKEERLEYLGSVVKKQGEMLVEWNETLIKKHAEFEKMELKYQGEIMELTKDRDANWIPLSNKIKMYPYDQTFQVVKEDGNLPRYTMMFKLEELMDPEDIVLFKKGDLPRKDENEPD